MKKKRNYTRRHRTFILLAVAAALIFTAAITRSYGFLPSDVVRDFDESTGAGPSEIIGRAYNPKTKAVEYLSVNDGMINYSASGFGADGWSTMGGMSMYLSQAPEQVQLTMAYDLGYNYIVLCAVRDTAVETIEASVRFSDASEDKMDVIITANKDGITYFLAESGFLRERLEQSGAYTCIVSMTDNAGNELYKETISGQT